MTSFQNILSPFIFLSQCSRVKHQLMPVVLWYAKLPCNVSFHQHDFANLVRMHAIAILGMDDAKLTEYLFGGS